MDRQILNFTANEQTLIVENPIRISTNKVNYIEAHFSLGANWSGYDSVRAVWFNDYQTISTVLDSQGVTFVPFEVMKRKGNVKVNLVGSISENDVLTDRLTSYPVVAVIVDCIAQITGAETNPITPSQFEQYVAIVRDLVDSVKDIDYIELNDDYTLTIYYSDGTSYTTTSIRGKQGADGNGIASVELNPDYTLTITYTDGTSYTTTSIRGEKGEKGDKGEQGEVSQAQLDAVVSDLKSEISDMSDVEYGKNRFNASDIVANCYLDSNGEYVSHAKWSTSGYCYVKGFTNIIGSASDADFTNRGALTPFFICTYDENKNFIEQLASTPVYPITLNSNVAYIRFCLGSTTIQSTVQIEKGNTYSSYEAYSAQRIIRDVARSNADAKDSEVLKLISDDFSQKYGKNRFNSKFVSGYLGTDGSLKYSDEFYTTDFIDVGGLVTVTASIKSGGVRIEQNMSYCCAYDSNKDFVSYYGNLPGSTLTIASGTKYIRFSINHDASAEEIQVEQGTAISSYEPFSYHAIMNKTALPNKIMNLNDDLVVALSKNRYNGKYVSGYLKPDGTIYYNASFKTTDYIDVTGFDYVTASFYNSNTNARETVNMFYCCAYDENKTFISQYGSMPGATLAVASGTHFIRFSRGDLDSLTQLQVEQGQNLSSYAAYAEKASSSSGILKWFGKKWVCVGDSLTEANSKTTKHYFDYISDITGIRVINMGDSGTGYARGIDSSSAFYNRIENVPSDADVVTIFGSGNDGGAGLPLGEASDTGTSSLAGYINSTIDKLYLINPIISLGIVTPSPWVGNMPYDDGWMEKYSNLIVEICKSRSIPCLDLFHCSGLDPNSSAVRSVAYSNDDGGGVHPNEAGHRLIASKFKAFLEALVI